MDPLAAQGELRPSGEGAAGFWLETLSNYSEATGLVVSLLDDHDARIVGPLLPRPFQQAMARYGAWAPDGMATRIETALADRVRGGVRDPRIDVDGPLRVQALSVPGGGAACVVFGWLPSTFPSSLGAVKLAAGFGMPPGSFWPLLRLQGPVSNEKMRVYAGLLESLIAFGAARYQQIAELHELQHTRELLLAHVSHELRTPLGAIANRCALLLSGKVTEPEQREELLRGIDTNVKQEARLVEDLIDTARSRTGQLTLRLERMELRAVLEGALSAVVPVALMKGVDLTVDPIPSGIFVNADGERLQQAFWNLLSNAVKFTPPQGVITVAVARADGRVSIRIKDSGPGIAASELSRVFELFVRRTSNNDTGLGIGLHLTRELVTRMGGVVVAHSEGLGLGASFEVGLPIAEG